jgi:hypothetical protein
MEDPTKSAAKSAALPMTLTKEFLPNKKQHLCDQEREPSRTQSPIVAASISTSTGLLLQMTLKMTCEK